MLSTTRGRTPDVAAHRLATSRGDERGLMAEIGLTALQAWQRLAESQDRGRGKADVAILFADLGGFSTWALEAGDAAAVRLLGEFTAVVEPAILDRRGEVVKRLGDGVMAAFWDPTSAVEAALRARREVGAIRVEDFRPKLRTGIHLGRPRRLGGDYFGVDVNVAARLTEAAKPDEVLVSGEALAGVAAGTVEARRCRFRAKGVPDGLTAYSVTEGDAAADSATRGRGRG
jgi:class 3 adenylate cyclase